MSVLQCPVTVRWSPAHELTLSFHAYVQRTRHRTLELGEGWAGNLDRRLPPALVKSVRALTPEQQAALLAPGMLICGRPAGTSAEDFLSWLGGLSDTELRRDLVCGQSYSVVREHPDPRAARDRYLPLLRQWHECYYVSLDQVILEGLAQDAQDLAERAATAAAEAAPADLVDEVTGGLEFQDDPALTRYVLVPQYHYRPWNLYDRYHTDVVCMYPSDRAAQIAGEPAPVLRRAAQALADSRRLAILQVLKDGSKTFSELVQAVGMPKSSVHYHLVALRAGGLVRVRIGWDGTARFSLRDGSPARLAGLLAAYLQPAGPAQGG